MGREVLLVSALTRTLSPMSPVSMISALTAVSSLSVCIPTSPVIWDSSIFAQHCVCWRVDIFNNVGSAHLFIPSVFLVYIQIICFMKTSVLMFLENAKGKGKIFKSAAIVPG